MANLRILRNSFAGGEVAQELFGRVDLDKYAYSLELCRNFITLPHGPVINRPGFQFVREVDNSNYLTRLIPFSFSNTQTFAIEMGLGYFRFHNNGAILLNTSTGLPYKIGNVYAQADLALVKYVQSGDVITFTHPSYPPYELRRLGNTNWTFTVISFASALAAPAGAAATATYINPGVVQNFNYRVTALNSYGFEESLPSGVPATIVNDLTISGNFNTITWAGVTGAARYNVYKYAAGSWGYIAQTSALSTIDDNILADLSRTIPLSDPTFNTTNNYPTAVNYYEQRRFFAGSNSQPMNVWGTQSASDYNMSYSIPSQDSDALRFKIAASRANAVRHIVSLQDLVLMTASTEWRIFSGAGNALVPSSVTIKAQSQNGASHTAPVVVNNSLLYEQAQGGHIREMAYDWKASGYASNDVSLLAPHLFDNLKIVDMAFSRAPTPILWCVSSSGDLLGLTYVPEQQITSWHKHTTDGVFESCCTVTENDQDVLYVIVRRNINGVSKRFVEVLHSRYFATQADAFFVDAGLTYIGAATTHISGLDHLEGKTVAVLGDGAVMSPHIVTSGAITLEYAVSKAQVGLPIVATLKTLPTYFQDASFGLSRVKNVNKVWVRIKDSGMFYAGPDEARLTKIMVRTFEAPGTPAVLKTGEYPLVIKSDWNQTGQVMLRQIDPLPLEVVYIASEVSIGG